MTYTEQPQGVDYFGAYIPSANEAAAIFALTGSQVARLATPMEEEFGTGGDPSIITGLDLEFGGAGYKLELARKKAETKQRFSANVPHNITDEEPVLVITDIARDVDDIEALAYLTGAAETEVAGIATTHMIPDRRAFVVRAAMNHIGRTNVPIGVGSIFPVGQEHEQLTTYLKEHNVAGRTYEGEGLVECFPTAEEVIINAIARYGKRLKIAVLAPLTDLAKVVQMNSDLVSTVGGIYIQGQATVENGQLVPSDQAYNLQTDMPAAGVVFGMQDRVPFTLMGKFAAYQLPLGRDTFDAFEATSNKTGAYMKTSALAGIRCFAERAPHIFTRVFGVQPDQVDTLDELSKPYDALLAMAITSPELFDAQRIGHHSLIGMTPETHGIKNPTASKQKLVSTILRALTASR